MDGNISHLRTVNPALEGQKIYKIMGSYFNYQLPLFDQNEFKQKQSPNLFTGQELKHRNNF